MSTWYDTGFVMGRRDAEAKFAANRPEPQTVTIKKFRPDKTDESQSLFESERQRGYRLAWNAAVPDIKKFLDVQVAIFNMQEKEIKAKEAALARVKTLLSARKKLDQTRELTLQPYEDKLTQLRQAIDSIAAQINASNTPNQSLTHCV